MSNDIPQEMIDQVNEMISQHPEFVEKFGNPLDESDPRNWSPSERKERGVSAEDRLTFLELDVEGMKIVLNRVAGWMMDVQRKELLVEMQKDPMGFVNKLMGYASKGEHGPNGDNGPAYAGSTVGIAPETVVETVDGPIRADQIPGYRNDPEWRPSPDWTAANCTCPAHTAEREQAKGKQIGNDDGFPTGFYL